MRLPAQDGQSLTLHEKGTTRGPRQDAQRGARGRSFRKAVGQIAARRDGTELALDKVRQRALDIIAAGDEVIEVVPQEARESAGLRVPRLADLCEQGTIRPVIDTVYPLDQIAQAHTHSDSGRARGKFVVKVR